MDVLLVPLPASPVGDRYDKAKKTHRDGGVQQIATSREVTATPAVLTGDESHAKRQHKQGDEVASLGQKRSRWLAGRLNAHLLILPIQIPQTAPHKVPALTHMYQVISAIVPGREQDLLDLGQLLGL